ncbi:MAG: hypothetical protein HYW79_01995 [Parcubacteria group bacterium]|nr:hypothetical protein [Parcubacteria group bacterium]
MVELATQKSKSYTITWRWPLRVSLVFFFLTISAFIFFRVYLSGIETDIVNINNQIKVEAAKVSKGDEMTIANLADSLTAFSGLVANHSYLSKMMELIGSLTYSKVVFTKFDVDREKSAMQLKGSAQNYTALAKQMVALRENENVKNLEVKGINFGTSGLDFELVMLLDPKIFIR